MALCLVMTPVSYLHAQSTGFAEKNPTTIIPFTPAAGKTCKQVDSCEEAVELWCGGYRRADADSDGIPCENICRSLQQVDAIRQRAGC